MFNAEKVIAKSKEFTEINNELDYEKASRIRRLLRRCLDRHDEALSELVRNRKMCLAHSDKIWNTEEEFQEDLLKESDQAEIDADKWFDKFRKDIIDV